MNEELRQVVLDPSENTSADYEAVLKLLDADPVYISRRTKIRLLVAQALHPFGVHSWAKMRQFDRASGRLIETGWRVCLYCPKTRLQ